MKKPLLLTLQFVFLLHLAYALTLFNERSASRTRRRIVAGSLASLASLIPSVCRAQGNEIKPYAPTEYLLPAVRVKRVIDDSLQIATTSQDLEKIHTLLFDSRLLNDKSSIKALRPSPIYDVSYQQSRSQLSLLEKPGALLIQNGERRTWKILQDREKRRESSNTFRAALNYYTDNLQYDANRYIMADAALRKDLIRKDSLPAVEAVVAADLDLRALYRNQLLNAIDDVRAEVEYEETDMEELVQLLRGAQQACDKWFSFIDEKDVKQAFDTLDTKLEP